MPSPLKADQCYKSTWWYLLTYYKEMSNSVGSQHKLKSNLWQDNFPVLTVRGIGMQVAEAGRYQGASNVASSCSVGACCLIEAFGSWCLGTFPIISMAPCLLLLEHTSCFHGWLALHKACSFWHCHQMVLFKFSKWICNSHCACSKRQLYPEKIWIFLREKEHLYFFGCQELLEPFY